MPSTQRSSARNPSLHEGSNTTDRTSDTKVTDAAFLVQILLYRVPDSFPGSFPCKISISTRPLVILVLDSFRRTTLRLQTNARAAAHPAPPADAPVPLTINTTEAKSLPFDAMVSMVSPPSFLQQSRCLEMPMAGRTRHDGYYCSDEIVPPNTFELYAVNDRPLPENTGRFLQASDARHIQF